MNELKVKIKPLLDRNASRKMQDQLGTPNAMGGGKGGNSPLLGEQGFGGLLKTSALTLAALGAIGVGVGMVVKRFAQASPALAGVLDLMGTAVNMILEPMGRQIAMHLFPLAKHMIQLATDFRQTFTNEGMSAALDGLYKGVMHGIANGFGITGVLDSMWASIGRSLDGMSSFLNTAVADLQRIGTDIKNLPGNIARAIKGAIPSVPSVPSGGDLLGQARGLIPFAKGGVVTGPTPALVGEAGPEAIIPLDRLQSGITIQFNGNVYGMNDFERQVQTIVNRYGNRRNYA